MNDMTRSPAAAAPNTASQADGFQDWCDRVRQLLGWSDGSGDDWPALYAAGHSPRDAARTTVYGDTGGE